MGDTIQTVEDLGKKLKAKYPGSYDDIADAELGSRLKAKHPEYSDFADVPGSGAMPNLKGTPVGGVEGAAPIVGRMAAESLPAVGATVGEMVEPAGGGILGAGAGSVAKRMLKSKFPKYFGEQSEDPASAGVDVAKDIAIQGGTGALANLAHTGIQPIAVKIAASKYGRAFPAIQDAVKADLSRQVGGMAGSDVDALTNAANNTRQAGYGKFTRAADDEDTIGKKLVDLSSEVPQNIDVSGQRRLLSLPATDEIAKSNFKDISKQALSDVSHVRNFKAATGEPYTIEQLGLNKAIGKGLKADGSIDPDKILEELHGDSSDIYGEAITPQMRGTLGELLTKMKDAKANPSVDKLLNMSPIGKLFFAHSGGIAGYPLGHVGAAVGEAATAGTLGGVMLSNAMFKKLVSNPETAKLVIQAMKTPAGAPEADLIQKALTAAARGSAQEATVPDK